MKVQAFKTSHFRAFKRHFRANKKLHFESFCNHSEGTSIQNKSFKSIQAPFQSNQEITFQSFLKQAILELLRTYNFKKKFSHGEGKTIPSNSHQIIEKLNFQNSLEYGE